MVATSVLFLFEGSKNRDFTTPLPPPRVEFSPVTSPNPTPMNLDCLLIFPLELLLRTTYNEPRILVSVIVGGSSL